MSYDICLVDSTTQETLKFPDKNFLFEGNTLKGGTYAVGGTDEAWLNVTYNYAPHFIKVLGENGIRSIYGMTGSESVPILREAIDKLDDDYTDNYWDATEGNAKIALNDLLILAVLFPDGVWKGD